MCVHVWLLRGVCVCCRLALSDALDKLAANMQRQQAATVSNTAGVLRSGMRVLTTSLSSTVAKALIQAHQHALAGQPAGPAAAVNQAALLGSGPDASAPAAAASGVAAAASAQQQQQQQAADDWVDDPEFWPETSGIGREQLSGGNSSASGAIFPSFLVAGGADGSGFKGSSRGPGISVVVCESRPLCEGVTMAQRLAAAGLQVTLITDAQAGVFVEEADAVLLGADAVTPDGVVNKVGSRLLALAAKAAGVPMIAVTDSLKVSPGPVAQFALPNTVLQVRRCGWCWRWCCACFTPCPVRSERTAAGLQFVCKLLVPLFSSSRADKQEVLVRAGNTTHSVQCFDVHAGRYVVVACCLQAGEEEKDASELLPAWGSDVSAAVTKLAATSARSSMQDAQEQQQQQQRAAGHAQLAATSGSGSGSSSSAADASALAPGGSIELRNVYFEAVPLGLVSAVISDRGVMSQAQVAELMQARGKGYEQAFGLSLPDDMLAA